MYKVIEFFIDTSTQVLCVSYFSGGHIHFRLKPTVSTTIRKVDFERIVNRVFKGIHAYMTSEVGSSER